jgi:hypothetical protein
MSKEEFLEFALSRVRDKPTRAGWQNLRANFELQYDYPDEYVVFLDDWTGEGRNRRLERRVLDHAPPGNSKRLSDLVASLSGEDRLRVQFVFADDPFTNEIRG